MITTKLLDSCGPWKYEHRCDKGHPPLLTGNPDSHCPECDDEEPLEVHRLRAENTKLRHAIEKVNAERSIRKGLQEATGFENLALATDAHIQAEEELDAALAALET